ncbi:hypothetical protein [Caldicellulosiruptor naganoensis]|uniref:Uncharacterized protein n=1 Tax=Caldicellulosiruptor naganoensis TaxID=29324 RepID=A0ABY7BID6_9FIRM|nr:hypothetical protein [Caldicellulosiruptor naganoensis]WAM31637.1 hypothetical protein OTJ99_000064 [Caldicellulosiruptor naganoensis]
MKRQFKKAFLDEAVFMATAVLLLFLANVIFCLVNVKNQSQDGNASSCVALSQSSELKKIESKKPEIYVNVLRKNTKRVERCL